MIGHYLQTLTQEEEDRVLTQRLAYAPFFVREDGCRCLRGVVEDMRRDSRKGSWQRGFIICWNKTYNGEFLGPGGRFDQLCTRFGEDRVNAAIRNRILSNRARRLLAQPQPELVETL